MSDKWYYADGDERLGPVGVADLSELIGRGRVQANTLVWKSGMPAWSAACDVPGLMPVRPSVTAPERAVPSAKYPLMAMTAVLSCGAGGELWLLTGPNNKAAAFAIVILLLVTMTASAVMNAVFVYRSWACLPASHRTISPGLAVGLMFVPFYNLFWVFGAIGELSRNTNRALQDRGKATSVPEDSWKPACRLFVAWSLLFFVPVVGELLFAACSLLFGRWMLAQSRAAHTLTGKTDPDPDLHSIRRQLLVSAVVFALLAVPTAFVGAGDKDREPVPGRLPAALPFNSGGYVRCANCSGTGKTRDGYCPRCRGTGIEP